MPAEWEVTSWISGTGPILMVSNGLCHEIKKILLFTKTFKNTTLLEKSDDCRGVRISLNFCFPSTQKRKAGVFEITHFEERFQTFLADSRVSTCLKETGTTKSGIIIFVIVVVVVVVIIIIIIVVIIFVRFITFIRFLIRVDYE